MATHTILVIDDDEGITGLVTLVLRHNGYRVLEATDGLQALDVIAQEAPDLVLLDLLMPGMNGFQVLEVIRARDRAADRHTVVIFLTAHSPQHIKAEAGEGLQADACIIKPITVAELTREIARQLAGRAAA